MAKLKYGEILYKKCSNCGTEYEGGRCIKQDCRKVFNSSIDRQKGLYALILLGLHPEEYTLMEEMCNCPECKNLFILTDDLIKWVLTCCYCSKFYFDEEELKNIIKGKKTLLMKCRAIQNALNDLRECTNCHKKIILRYWCPLNSDKHNNHNMKGLPQRYKRMYYRNINK